MSRWPASNYVPFRGATAKQIMSAVADASPTPLTVVDKNIPHALEDICNKCLQKTARTDTSPPWHWPMRFALYCPSEIYYHRNVPNGPEF